jgi:hypothetical protein
MISTLYMIEPLNIVVSPIKPQATCLQVFRELSTLQHQSVAKACFSIGAISMSIKAILYGANSLVHIGEGRSSCRTFPFTSWALITLKSLKWMGARDCLSVLAHTPAAIIKLHNVYCHFALLMIRYITGFSFKSTKEINIVTLTGYMTNGVCPN